MIINAPEPDSNVPGEDISSLRRKYGRWYDIFPAGRVLCAYREGRDQPPLRAMTPEELAAAILADLKKAA